MQLWKRINELTITKRLRLAAGSTIEFAGKVLNMIELATLDGQADSVAMTSTPATGSCAVQFTFKDSAGATLSRAFSGIVYASSANGLATGAVTSAAVLTNGALIPLSATLAWAFTSTADGLLGVTVTAGAGTYYLTFQLSCGRIITSGAIVVN